ncbi:MAG: protein kinase [Deltaproteobacteria bacterium]|nr:protein kinase [Deltaproteobacteria bacterium]
MPQLAPNTEFGAYHIIRPIGGGGMAQIYLAKARGLAGFEKLLALKVINPEYAGEDRFIQMLIDEAKITVGLSHVNIAQVFDLGQSNGIYYIAMEFVDGCDVLELVNGLHSVGERLPIEAVAYIGRQIAAGLHYAHTRKDKTNQPLNIVHRDISPQNILVSRAGEVKVVDFGIAKAANMSTKTQAGVIKGKVNYMAPEQAMGQKADRRTDIFSVGIVMWEMLTAQMVYASGNVGELVAAVRKADIRPPSAVRKEIPPALDRIVLKALAARTTERYQTAHALQVDLTRFLSSTAPDYGGSHLAVLVERAIGQRRNRNAGLEADHLSREDLLADRSSLRNSLIHDLQPAAQDHAQLVVRTDQGEKLLPLDRELIIGRAGQLAISDARVSRQHARIYHEEGEYLLEDLGSSNGTWLNGERISEPRRLQDRDEVRIGSCHIRFVAGRGASAPRPAAEASREPDGPPKLVINSGGELSEQRIDPSAEVSFRVQVGPLRLYGVSGRLVRRQDGVWLEPEAGSRLPVRVNGDESSRPVRLSPGDTVEVGPVSCRLAHETRPFEPAARNRH